MGFHWFFISSFGAVSVSLCQNLKGLNHFVKAIFYQYYCLVQWLTDHLYLVTFDLIAILDLIRPIFLHKPHKNN